MFEVFQTQRICWDTNVSFILNWDMYERSVSFMNLCWSKPLMKVRRFYKQVSQFKVKTTSLNDWILKILNKYEENIVKHCSHVWVCRLCPASWNIQSEVHAELRRAAAVGLMINKTFSGHFLPEYSGWCRGWECLKDVLAAHSRHVTPGHVTRDTYQVVCIRNATWK